MGQDTRRTCLITGASRGLGEALARELWAREWNLVLVARDAGALDRLAASLGGGRDGRIVAVAEDLAREDADARIRARTEDAVGRIDALVHNAAIQGPIGELVSNGWYDWEQALRVNLLAPVALTRACVPLMTPGGTRRKILFVSGGGATAPRPRFSAYATAKSGLVRFAETIAQELASRGIDVNCVAPGAMASAMTDAVLQAGPDVAGPREFDAARQLRRAEGGTFHRAVGLCCFLLSPASDGITGKLLSAAWDPWERFAELRDAIMDSDVYTLRRIVPKDRGLPWE
jgi:3-oxoacyl-[acyl-carrier protein] reductase